MNNDKTKKEKCEKDEHLSFKPEGDNWKEPLSAEELMYVAGGRAGDTRDDISEKNVNADFAAGLMNDVDGWDAE